MRSPACLSSFALLLGSCVGPARAEPQADDAQRCWGVQSTCNVRGNLRVARRVDRVPAVIAKRFPGKPLRVYEIDLDSDGRPDFIVEEGPPAPATCRTCFVDSAGRVRSCAPGGGDGFAYYWFAQLDGDPMLELFAMEGDEDSSDYRIQKLDPKSWQRRDIVRIDPILFHDNGGRQWFWGYPWDISDLVLTRRGGRILLRAAPPGPTAAYHESGKSNVAIVFTGTPTQEGPTEGFEAVVKASRLMSLDEVVRASRANTPPPPKR